MAGLQRRVRELSHELAAAKRTATVAEKAQGARPASETQIKRAVETARRDYDRQFAAFNRRMETEAGKMRTALRKVREIASAAAGILMPIAEVPKPPPATLPGPTAGAQARLRPLPLPPPQRPREEQLTNLSNRQFDDGAAGSLGKGAVKMLKVLAQRSPIRLSRSQLGTLSGYTASGGTFGNYFSQLRRAGLIAEDGQGVFATDEGVDFAGQVPPAPETHEEIVAMWRTNLPAGPAKMLDVLLERWPDWMTREDLGDVSGYTGSGGTFGNYFSILRRNGLVELRGQEVRAAEALFP